MKTFSGMKTCSECGNIIQNDKCSYCEPKITTHKKGYAHQSHKPFEKAVYKTGSIEVGEKHMAEIRQKLGVTGIRRKVDRMAIQLAAEKARRDGEI